MTVTKQAARRRRRRSSERRRQRQRRRTATYRITFANPLSAADNGTYTVDLPADAIKDAAGNSAAAGTLGTFALNVGSPTDPDLTVDGHRQASDRHAHPRQPKAKGTAKVKVTNIGQTAITKQNVPVTLYLSDNQSRDAADIQLGDADQAADAQDRQEQDAVVQVHLPGDARATARTS